MGEAISAHELHHVRDIVGLLMQWPWYSDSGKIHWIGYMRSVCHTPSQPPAPLQSQARVTHVYNVLELPVFILRTRPGQTESEMSETQSISNGASPSNLETSAL